MLEIFRDNLCIHCDTSTVPYQGSVNVPIKLTEINEEDLYSDYAIQPKVSYHDGTSWQSVLLPFEDGEFSLPTNVFAVNGIKKIAIGLIKGDKEYVTNDLKIIVNSAPTGTLVLPTSPQWNELVDAYMEQQYNNSYKVTLDEYLKDFNKLLEALEIKCDATINEVNQKISTVYKPCGSVEFANLPILADEELGNVYNLSDDFTTTADFIEGEGLDYPAGTNIAVVEVEGVKMFDVLAGMFDTSDFMKKDDACAEGIAYNNNDSGLKADSVQGAIDELMSETDTTISKITSMLGEGGIDEYVSNRDNGYIRFKNGFTVNWRRETVTTSIVKWTDAINYSDHVLGSWLKPFTTFITLIPTVHSTLYWVTTSGASATAAGNVRVFRPTYHDLSVIITVVGFGFS